MVSASEAIFQGDPANDYVLPHFSWDGVFDRYPRVTRQLFEHSGHQPFLEEPVRFCSVVNAWLAGQ